MLWDVHRIAVLLRKAKSASLVRCQLFVAHSVLWYQTDVVYMASAVPEVVFNLYCLFITPREEDDIIIWQK